jgi:hypothetical protein
VYLPFQSCHTPQSGFGHGDAARSRLLSGDGDDVGGTEACGAEVCGALQAASVNAARAIGASVLIGFKAPGERIESFAKRLAKPGPRQGINHVRAQPSPADYHSAPS